ncbi:Hpt domain-containing protein [Frateuria terrea]|uniref:Chemotaxis protein CheA n=1 Tax=Frateuria terrea TaxID=529704 RepID=A0A1H6XMW4_9GAMM|nr:Hpt domain-containing protein [Frateuria terrea]SEJ30413.1 chemosensory pili system protein ChpA (sensor histidine kinase/response regulator) [Frateuria terrea]SFP52766.1 chemosensory pili system protein ChpA (sensor histidine kinase/response regulator) [Frateuria terrea]
MRLQDHIDFTTLQWVKPELDETLAQAREALESYVENPGKREVMRACVDHLHQVQGTLRMVELYGAAMVAEEMETLAICLLEDHVRQREDAFGALMRGLMQLPDYLERLSGGHRDVPVVLLPLLNDLRASRDQQALSEAALFSPNLEQALPVQAPGAQGEVDVAAQRGAITTLRLQFQQQLLAWFRGQNAAQQLVAMRETLLSIAGRCWTVPGRRLWWIAAGVLEGLEQGMLKSHAAEIRQLIGKVDRNIRQLVEQGEASLRGGDADELASKLLYILAQARQASPQMALLKQTYRLDSLLPDAAELEHARGSMAGHNRALLDSVSKALKEDLLRVKEALDLFLRQSDGDPAQLAAQGEVLERVGDTLGMLALAVPRRVVNEQRRVLEEIAHKVRAPEEGVLLDVAGALLYVESSLDDHIESLGAEDNLASETLPVEGEAVPALPRSEARSILATLMQEAIANAAKVKDAIVAFVEAGWDHAQLQGTPALMDEVAGAMRMLSAPRPSELAEGIGRFIGNEMLADRRVPGSAQMDHLADALAALEYYLEAAREHRGGLEHILDVAEHSLGSLGYWPLPAARAAVAYEAPVPTAVAEPAEPSLSEPVSLADGHGLDDLLVGSSEPLQPAAHDLAGLRLAQTEPLTASSGTDGEGDWIEIEEEVLEEVPAADALAGSAGFQLGTEGIDDDIREIFLEEMQEEIDNLRAAEQAWLVDPAQLAALTPIRRSFHTLKGSGRLVGASVLGEFAWKVENMLNRVLDATIQPHEGVQALVHTAIDALPQLLAALKGEGMPTAPLAAIMATAERLAAGEMAQVSDHAPAATETVRRVVRRRVPRLDAAIDAVPVAAHTDHTAAVDLPSEPLESIALPVMPPVDPVLLEILRSEVAQYLQAIRGALARADGELRIDDALLRAVHTLHGAIAMVDIPLLTQLLSPLESLLKRLRAVGQPLSEEGTALLAQSADVVDHVMAQFDAVDPQLPSVDALTARLIELRDSQPEPKVAHVLFDPHAEELSTELPDDGAAAALDAGLDDALGESEPVTTHEADEHDAYAGELLAALDAFDLEAAEAASTDVAPVAHAGLADDDQGLAALLDSLLNEPVDGPPLAVANLDGTISVSEGGLGGMPELAAEEAGTPEQQLPGDSEAELAAVALPPEALDAPNEDTDAQTAEFEALSTEVAEPWAAEPDAVSAEPFVESAGDTQEPVAAGMPEVPVVSVEATAETEPVAAADAPPMDDRTPAQLWVGQIDPDLLEIFTEEAHELLDHADDLLAQWRADPSETTHAAGVQRDLHTLKGGARIAGLVPVGDLTHAIETLLEKPVGERDTAQLISALEAGFDTLHSLVQRVSQGQPIEYPQALIDSLLAMAGQETLADEGNEASSAMPSARLPAAPLPELLPELLPEREEEEIRSTQEQIRVRAELLDNLVNHAGEVAIYRSRLEQQVAGYRFNLVELDQTVQRLRSQLRMLEIETEAQIIARFQREHREAGMAVFDPLELDRFSQLQQYSRALAESVSDLVSIQNMLDELTRQSETLLIQQSRVSAELQDGLLRTRMLPFDTMVPNLRRTLRQAAQEEGKSAQLYVEGAHGEMDRNLLDRIKAPFEHMLRNAIAHGIESPADRRKAGKPTEGAVRIRVAREATEVVVRVSDDGGGLDREAIRKRAIERGLLRADSRPSDDQLLSLITQTGFSTASHVTQLAGRGVGMDVVSNEIKQLGGSLAIESLPGQGTTFILRLPFTLAVTQAIVVRIGEATFAIPMTSVQGVARISPDDLAARLGEERPTFDYNGEAYGIHDLADLLGLQPNPVIEEEQLPLLLTRAGDLRAAIRIDAVIGSREIVVKSVGPQVSSVPGVLGATIMGDGSVLIILDLPPLVRHGIARREQRLADGLSAVASPLIEEQRTKPLVMVVDDSITMRKVTGRVLERHDYEVATAKDGVDAIEKLHDRVPDLMLLDIEMPRMDGYELATHMKGDPRLRDVPIIMITSRTGDKHRQRAFDIGVDRYLGKPYQEVELLAQIAEVLEQRAMAMEAIHG